MIAALRAAGFAQREAAPNVGYLTPMATTPQAGGLVTLNDTQLITARVNEPRQWVITMAQVGRAGNPQGPWLQNFDGTPYNNVTAQFGAPVTPQQPGVSLSMLQVRVSWGAGAVRFSTAFDYPLMGGSFGLTADTVNVDVTLHSAAAQTPILPATVPVVGALMVPGQAVDPTPLRWLEPEVNLPANSGATWSVKPYARKVHIVAPTCAKIFGGFFIVTGVANNLQMVKRFNYVEPVAGAGIDVVVDVPAQAEALGFTNNTAGAAVVDVEWHIGLV